jgi:hypothetical protein
MLCTRNQLLLMGDEQEAIQTINVFENNEDEIHEVLKLSKGVLILSKKDKMKLYVEDTDELTYVYKGQVVLPAKDNQKIMKIVLSANNDEVLLRTNSN